ncbi:MAG: SDR family NAD(P)-dependent oxidoreductase [Phototrophicaceae bacterium]
MTNLKNKHILVFAATGAIAKQAAQQFAAEGAHVYLSGRDAGRVEAIANDIRNAGGQASADVVDATNADAVSAYVARIAAQAGQIDGVFNGIGGRPVELGYPQVSAMTSLNDFMIPFEVIVASQFLTAREAAKFMKPGASVLFLSASLSRMTAPFMAGISAAQGAIEALTRALAGEYGQAGIRVNCVRGSGMYETRTIQETGAAYAAMGLTVPMSLPPLGHPISVADTVKTATYLLSDLSSGLTGQVVDVSAGLFV